ncbi:BQ5605_C013g07256 [Microbotryum silenes-dioicae]|uniref:BQ5605_C013g07256 protein n=1 Tax=Microbotryum silenes-dioicae TaxID=796604 RepID=A0A2X0MKR3_9BASI|nr:BQ5605_C013g07256 [Microbotryum silenes-dioicae]
MATITGFCADAEPVCRVSETSVLHFYDQELNSVQAQTSDRRTDLPDLPFIFHAFD